MSGSLVSTHSNTTIFVTSYSQENIFDWVISVSQPRCYFPGSHFQLHHSLQADPLQGTGGGQAEYLRHLNWHWVSQF